MVGISGYGAAAEGCSKPKVSAFINARFEKIDALKPDLVLAFSDLQADIAAELIRRGYPVVTFNQRSIDEILRMIRTVGALVGRQSAAETLADHLNRGLDEIRDRAARLPRRPRVFFEEWDDPLISGICWVDTDRDCRRRAALPSLETRLAGKGPHRHARRRARPRSGGDHRLLVRKGDEETDDRGTAGLVINQRGA